MSTEKTGEIAGNERDEQLRTLVAEHEARLTEIADLVAHVRHEINNPLTGVIGQAQLLLREELSQSARRRVETIEHLAGRIRDTVAELRAVQRPRKKGGGQRDEGWEGLSERQPTELVDSDRLSFISHPSALIPAFRAFDLRPSLS